MLALYLLALTLLFGIVSLVIDVGYLQVTKARIQKVADLAVLTAVASIKEDLPYELEVLQVKSVVAMTAENNGLSRNAFTVETVRHPDRDDLMLARVLRAHDTPTFFARLLGIESVKVGILAAAEVFQGGIGYGGGGIGLFGELLVDAFGNVFIDSYNSDVAPYNPSNIGPDGRPYDRKHGNVVGNVDATLGGSFSFHGDAYFGNDVNVAGGSGFLLGNVLAGGTISAADGIISGFQVGGQNMQLIDPVPATAPADIATSNDNGLISGYFDADDLADDQILSKGSGSGPKQINLPAGGTYYFKEVDLPSNVNITLLGAPAATQTVIYLDGPAKILGGIVNGGPNPKPADLRIESIVTTPLSAPIQFGGQASIYADIYSPLQEFGLAGGGELYGRAFAKRLDLHGNTKIHYDESLAPNSGGVLTGTSARRRPRLVE